jgi:galactokinase
MGIKGGILDQFAIVFGKKDYAALLNCDTQDFEYYPLELAPYTLVLINSGIQHDHATSGYNERAAECKKALQIIQSRYPLKKHLSDVSKLELENCEDSMESHIYKRARFVREENARVVSFCAALKLNDFLTMGKLLTESHDGLASLFEVSCLEIDFLVKLAQTEEHILGSRMMGGGFGGCTLNLVHKDHADGCILRIKNAYRLKFNIDAEVIDVYTSQGLHIIQV